MRAGACVFRTYGGLNRAYGRNRKFSVFDTEPKVQGIRVDSIETSAQGRAALNLQCVDLYKACELSCLDDVSQLEIYVRI